MTFLQNSRYRRFENENRGDIYRGLANKKFPWTIHERSAPDHSGDAWRFIALCDSITPNEVNQLCEIVLRFEAYGLLGAATLERLGIDSSRLSLFSDDTVQIRATQTLKVKIPLKEMEKVSLALLNKFIVVVHKRYDDNTKKATIFNNFENFPISRFST